MNNIDFTQTGGFPLTQDTMDFLQKSYQNPFGGLAKFIGNNALCVIDGCVVSGSTMTSGWIAYNGEILPFNGGTVQVTFLIRDTTQNLIYEDGTSHAVVHNRYAEFGVGVGAIAWNPIRLNVPLFTALVNSENHIATGGHSWDRITNTPFAYHGTLDIGNIYNGTAGSHDLLRSISFPFPITAPYMVIGSLEGYSGTWYQDNSITWSVSDKTSNGFKIGLYDTKNYPNSASARIRFNYIVFTF